MWGDLLARFFVGGAIVSCFATIGTLCRPKSFAGLFGAAPSVALASMALSFGDHSDEYLALEARSMLIGAFACLGYAGACVAVARTRALPVWLGAVLSWIVWGAIACLGFTLLSEAVP